MVCASIRNFSAIFRYSYPMVIHEGNTGHVLSLPPFSKLGPTTFHRVLLHSSFTSLVGTYVQFRTHILISE